MVAQASGVRASVWLGCVWFGAFALGCGGGELCDVERLQRALDRAEPGDVVVMGRCRIDGSVFVPDGITLDGRFGRDEPRSEDVGIYSSAGHAVELASDAVLRGVYVESSGETGVLVRGDRTTIEDVVVDTLRGAALAMQGGSATISAVELRGPVEDLSDSRFVRVAGFRVEGVCPIEPCTCLPGEVDGDRVCDIQGEWATWTAVYGIYARDSTVSLSDVSIRGFAEVGAVFVDSAVTWQGGDVVSNLGVGVLSRGGSGEFSDLRVSQTAEGLRGLAAYAIIADGGTLDSRGVEIADNDRYGLLLLDATGTHSDLRVSDNGDAGVWMGACDGVTINGDSLITGNGFAGIVVSASRNITVDGTVVERTRTVRRTLGDLTGTQEIGDGVHLSSSESILLRDVDVSLNARGGLLVDLSIDTPMFENVNVDVSVAGFGAVAGTRDRGDLTVMPGGPWDTGISRTAEAVTRDTALTGTLDVIAVSVPPSAMERVGIVFPMF